MSKPSLIPPEGRPLAPEEQQALLQEMENIMSSSILFKSMDAPGRKSLLESGYVCVFSPGEEVITQGTVGDTMYMILKGTVKVSTQTNNGDVKLATLARGACFGEVSVIKGGERTATVTAEGQVDLVAFKRHRIERVLSEYPKVKQRLEALVEGRAHDTIKKIVDN